MAEEANIDSSLLEWLGDFQEAHLNFHLGKTMFPKHKVGRSAVFAVIEKSDPRSNSQHSRRNARANGRWK